MGRRGRRDGERAGLLRGSEMVVRVLVLVWLSGGLREQREAYFLTPKYAAESRRRPM